MISRRSFFAFLGLAPVAAAAPVLAASRGVELGASAGTFRIENCRIVGGAPMSPGEMFRRASRRAYIACIKPEIERTMAQLRERYAGDHAAIDRAADSYVRELCGGIQDKQLRAAVFGIAWAARTDDKVREKLAAQLQVMRQKAR